MNQYFMTKSSSGRQAKKYFNSFFCRAVFSLTAIFAFASGGHAQTLTEPVRLIVAWPAGGPTDTVARIVAEGVGKVLKVPVIVENKAGASGAIGSAFVANSAPDGRTLLMAVFQDVTRTPLGLKQPFDTMKAFEPLIKIYDLPFIIMVNKSVLPVSNLKELLAYAKKGELQYATPSVGSMGHLSFELISQISGINAQHIAYKGSSQAIVDVVGGQVPMMYGDVVTALPQIQAGRLYPIAIGSESRIAALPDVPTIAESGFPGFLGVAWGGIVMPAGVSAPVQAQLYGAFKAVMSDPKVLAKIRQVGVEPALVANSASLWKFMHAEAKKWSDLIKDRGLAIN